MGKIRILIAEPEVSVGKLLKTLLSREADMEVVGVVGEGTGAKNVIQKTKPDVIIFDIKQSRFEIIRSI